MARGPWPPARARRTALVLALAAAAAGACGSGDTGSEAATAVWIVDAGDEPSATTESFTALVTRLGCGGGRTGDVRDPTVTLDAERVVVTFTVEPLSGAQTCEGNDEVPYTVDLGQALGDRHIVDGACLSGEAVSTTFCLGSGGVRWSPP